VNLKSLSDTIVLGRPCSLTTPSKKILATLEASEVREQDKKWAILEKRSTKTMTESCFLRVFGSPSTKFVLMSAKGNLGPIMRCTNRCSVSVALRVGRCDTFQHVWQRYASTLPNRTETQRLLWSSHFRNARLDHQHAIPTREIL